MTDDFARTVDAFGRPVMLSGDRVTEEEFRVKTPRFAVGQRFRTLGKHPRDCVVVDVLTTTNATGEVVRIRYVAEHEFMGGKVTDHDVLETTIARCLP